MAFRYYRHGYHCHLPSDGRTIIRDGRNSSDPPRNSCNRNNIEPQTEQEQNSTCDRATAFWTTKLADSQRGFPITPKE